MGKFRDTVECRIHDNRDDPEGVLIEAMPLGTWFVREGDLFIKIGLGWAVAIPAGSLRGAADRGQPVAVTVTIEANRDIPTGDA